jgi:HAMP domain-containing protein
MSSDTSPPSPNHFVSGRYTGVILFLVAALCIGLIGLAGFMKYELDRAQSALAAPELQLTLEQKSFDQIRRDLGYAGFLGSAQNYATTHNAAILSDMKAQLKNAGESMDRLPEATEAEARHDLQAILATFIAVMQKAEGAAAAPIPPTSSAPDFSLSDLLPLYAAVPVLDARVASALASNRLAEQNRAQFWATLLTIISWCSLIIAAALAAGIYLVLRDRNSAPMRALAQSVKNMARGDMRTSIWGMERQDAIGELARSIDMARFHFSQLPDMSLLSEQGPVRIRFEGNTRSLFEAMMRVISRDSEQVHEQASTLTQAVTQQQETLAHVIERVEAVLQNVEKRAMSGDVQVRTALQGMLGSAESLKNAQEHAADQLNRIIPFLQERSQGLSDIAQITGKQVAQALQSIMTTERGLRTSAEQSEEAIRKFSSTADTLGERMFGAVNLLQASGKVLAETTESAQGRFDAAIERIGSATFQTGSAPTADTGAAEKLGAAVYALESAHAKLENLLAKQTQTTEAHISLLTTQSGSLLSQASTSSQTLSSTADRLRDEQTRLSELLNRIGTQLEAPAAPEAPIVDITAPILTDIRQGFATLEQHVAHLHEQIATLLLAAETAKDKPDDADERMRDHWYQMAAQIEATRSDLAQIITRQAERVEAQVATLAASSEAAAVGEDISREMQDQKQQQLLILNGLDATRASLEDLLTQQSDRMEAQITDLATRSDTAAIGQEITQSIQAQKEQQALLLKELIATRSNLEHVLTQQADRVESQFADLATRSDTAAIGQEITRDIQSQKEQQAILLKELTTTRSNLEHVLTQQIDRVEAQFVNLATHSDTAVLREEIARDNQAQKEQQTLLQKELAATRSNLEQALTQQVDRLENQFGNLATRSDTTVLGQGITRDSQTQKEQQALLLKELVAMRLNLEHVLTNQIDRVETQFGNLATRSDTAVIGQEIARDIQVQKEQQTLLLNELAVTRSNLAQVMMQQTDRVEAQIANLVTSSTSAATEREFARDAQNQMEQQTLILNELVTTLGLLDAHMQEIRSQVSGLRQKAG